MNEYVIFWLNGTKSYCQGETEREAYTNAGHTNSLLRFVDFMTLKACEDEFSWEELCGKCRWKRIV